MTTTELQLKTSRFTAKMNAKEVSKLPEIIEDILDVRAYDRARKRIDKGIDRVYSHEEATAILNKKFGRL